MARKTLILANAIWDFSYQQFYMTSDKRIQY